MPTAGASRVVVLGGYGAFGARVCERLAASPDLELVVAGRSRERAERFARELAARSGASVGAAVMDAESITADHLMAERAALVDQRLGAVPDAGLPGGARRASMRARTTSISPTRAAS